MLIVNAIPLFLGPGSVVLYLLLAAAAIYVPAWLMDSSGSRKP
jgi:hypothetical protein